MLSLDKWKPELDPELCYQAQDEHRSRVRWILIGFSLACLLVLIRLFQIHMTPGERLSEEDQYHIGRMLLEEPRGEIFDRNGVVLATNTPVPSLYVDPREVEDQPTLANYLCVKLGMSEEEANQRLAKVDEAGKKRKMNPVKRWITDITPDELAKIESRDKALIVKEEPIRFYPHGDSAAHVLGFVNRAGEASEGLELIFDKHLHSRKGEILARKDNNRQLLPSGLLAYQEPEGGEMVQVTLDINIQHTLERCLDARMAEVGAKAALGLLMDPHTGAILALANRPAFDPNRYDDFSPELRKNRALLDVFEPGSSFKIITASAALENRLVTPDTMIDCENGGFNPYGHYIKDSYKLGVIPFSKAFAKSSNVAMIKLGALLGPERLDQWIRLYGFGQKTSPDFKFESAGLYSSRNKWSRLTMGSLPMGQEVAVTMPQLARAFAVIANGGHLVQPYYVEQSVDRYGNVTYKHEAPAPVRILSPETAATMIDLCHQVVLHGTGTTANIPEFRVGGKTGTAQMARAGGRGYDPDRYTAVFAGFAPVASPRVVGVIVIQEPSIRQRWGGYVCGPVFKEVVRDALIRLNVPEDPVVNPEHPEMEPAKPVVATGEAEEKKKEEQSIELAQAPESETEQDADTVAPPPAPEDIDANLDALISPLDGLSLVPRHMAENSGAHSMPDLTGLTKSQAREKLQRLGIVMDAQGIGWVVSQDPLPGVSLEGVKVCGLHFSDKMNVAAIEATDDTG